MEAILMGGVSLLALGGVGTALLGAFALRRVVDTNEAHIVQAAKKRTVFGSGSEAGNTYYAIPSFVPMFGVQVRKFPLSIFDVRLDSYEAYDIGRLPFQVDIQAFMRIADPGLAAQRLELHELQGQLKGILSGAVRRVLGEGKLEEILSARSELSNVFTEEVNKNLAEWGVTTTKAIEFMDIRDTQGSTVIAEIMAKDKSRISMESAVQVAANTKLAETARIEAKREVALREQEALQTIGQRTALKDKEVGIAQEQSTQEVLTAQAETMTREMAVKQVSEIRTAEIARAKAEIEAAQDREVQVIKAEADKSKMVIAAQADRERLETVAAGQLTAAKLSAEGTLADGTARAESERLMLAAPVSTQIDLAREIGTNEGYQKYLVTIEQVKANRDIGVAQADALKAADIKIIANGGDVTGGMDGVSSIFSSRGGQAIGAMISGIAQTPEGAAIVGAVSTAAKSATGKGKGNGASA